MLQYVAYLRSRLPGVLNLKTGYRI